MKVLRLIPLFAACLLPLSSAPARAEARTHTSTAQASLEFTVNIGKFMYLRLGDTGTTINTVNFNLAPTAPTPITNGNNQAVNWNGAAPTFAVAATGNQLDVTVRSNAGPISLRASTPAPLSNGSSTIPWTDITVSSINNVVPAPQLAASGNGPAVNVSGTASGQVIDLNDRWTFSYVPSSAPLAGVYNGQVTFTASAP